MVASNAQNERTTEVLQKLCDELKEQIKEARGSSTTEQLTTGVVVSNSSPGPHLLGHPPPPPVINGAFSNAVITGSFVQEGSNNNNGLQGHGSSHLNMPQHSFKFSGANIVDSTVISGSNNNNSVGFFTTPPTSPHLSPNQGSHLLPQPSEETGSITR